MFVGTVQEVAQILAHGVGCALVPTRTLRGLLGGEDLNEAFAKLVELVAGVDVPVQRGAVELRQHVDLAEAAVEAIADRDVNQPVLSAKRHRGFGALPRQRKEPGAGAAAHDDGEGIFSWGL